MNNNFRDYLRISYANKFILAGYLGVLGTGYTTFNAFKPTNKDILAQLSGMVGLFASIACLVDTKFGKETVETYRETIDHIDKMNTLDERFQKVLQHHYCLRVGVALAAKDRNLEHLLIPSIKHNKLTMERLQE